MRKAIAPHNQERSLFINFLLKYSALLNHGMMSLNLIRVFNGLNRLFIPHLCNAKYSRRICMPTKILTYYSSVLSITSALAWS
jgi:hypothetical protein